MTSPAALFISLLLLALGPFSSGSPIPTSIRKRDVSTTQTTTPSGPLTQNAIIAIAIGGVGGIAVVCFTFYYFSKRKRDIIERQADRDNVAAIQQANHNHDEQMANRNHQHDVELQDRVLERKWLDVIETHGPEKVAAVYPSRSPATMYMGGAAAIDSEEAREARGERRRRRRSRKQERIRLAGPSTSDLNGVPNASRQHTPATRATPQRTTPHRATPHRATPQRTTPLTAPPHSGASPTLVSPVYHPNRSLPRTYTPGKVLGVLN